MKEISNTPAERLQVLESLGYDLMDFDLYKSYIIFEESSAESLVREFLIPEFVPSLSGKVRTIAASGAGDLVARLHDFLRLFVFIHATPLYRNKAWVIADGDAAGKKAIADLQAKFKTWPQQHFIALGKPCIEEYYPEEFKERFSQISTIKDSKIKFEQKGIFSKDVMDWVANNKVGAKKHFKIAAKEIIVILKAIDKAISTKV